MTFIIDGLKYDTDKMEKIGKVKKWYRTDSWLVRQIYQNEEVGRIYDCKLWRSKKGNWLLTHETESKYKAEAIAEDEAKRLLMRYDYKKYEDVFEEIPEA